MPEVPIEEGHSEGVVIRSTGSWYDVRSGGGIVPCKVRGRFRLEGGDETNPVIVGDRVTFRHVNDDTGMIVHIHPRARTLVRRAAGRRVGKTHVIAANVDFAWVVQAFDLPRFNPGFVDRFLVMAGVNKLPAGIILNKADLAKTREAKAGLKSMGRLYESLGYPVVVTSAVAGRGVRKLAGLLRGQISVVVGPSGVGKSTLLNAIAPDLDLRTGTVSERTRKGTHTTTFASLHPLPGDGYVVDTPGLREYGLVNLDPAHLSHYFVEMQPVLPSCRYLNCTHDHEPECAVKDAVDEGRITIGRYDSYLGMLYSLHLGEKDVGR